MKRRQNFRGNLASYGLQTDRRKGHLETEVQVSSQTAGVRNASRKVMALVWVGVRENGQTPWQHLIL
jgi:hypothetical protein